MSPFACKECKSLHNAYPWNLCQGKVGYTLVYSAA